MPIAVPKGKQQAKHRRTQKLGQSGANTSPSNPILGHSIPGPFNFPGSMLQRAQYSTKPRCPRPTTGHLGTCTPLCAEKLLHHRLIRHAGNMPQSRNGKPAGDGAHETVEGLPECLLISRASNVSGGGHTPRSPQAAAAQHGHARVGFTWDKDI